MSVPHKDFDVVVVGFGVAGACAVIAAAESGARVLAVDRDLGRRGVGVIWRSGLRRGGTPYQKAAGYDEDAENMFNYLQQEVGGVVDDATLRRFCDGSVEQLAWLANHGAQFGSSLCEYKTSYPIGTICIFPATKRPTRTVSMLLRHCEGIDRSLKVWHGAHSGSICATAH